MQPVAAQYRFMIFGATEGMVQKLVDSVGVVETASTVVTRANFQSALRELSTYFQAQNEPCPYNFSFR